MAIVMHDLAGADPALRFSPYCWRTRMALAHKGLEVETIPWRFTERDALAFSGQGRVPVIRDGERVVSTVGRSPNIWMTAIRTVRPCSVASRVARMRGSSMPGQMA
jgi:hypothetical protein